MLGRLLEEHIQVTYFLLYCVVLSVDGKLENLSGRDLYSAADFWLKIFLKPLNNWECLKIKPKAKFLLNQFSVSVYWSKSTLKMKT